MPEKLLSAKENFLQIRPVRQKNVHYCGPAALQMVLSYFGIRESQEKLAEIAKTPVSEHSGTKPAAIVSALRRFGLSVHELSEYKDGDENSDAAEDEKRWRMLQKAFSEGNPAIVNYIEHKWDYGHYAVVIAVSNDHIWLIDPWRDRGEKEPIVKMSKREFMDRWYDDHFTHKRRWAVIALGNKKLSKNRPGPRKK